MSIKKPFHPTKPVDSLFHLACEIPLLFKSSIAFKFERIGAAHESMFDILHYFRRENRGLGMGGLKLYSFKQEVKINALY